MQGKFIVIEGLDGAGKSLAVDFIRQYFDLKGYKAIYTREPGGTQIAEDIRKLSLENYKNEIMYPDTELLLMYASRVQHLNRLIKPSLEKNINVVSDRFYWSSMAYQGGGRGINLAKIEILNNNFLGNCCKPDLTIYLDIDPILGLRRVRKIGKLDRIEKSKLQFFKRVREVYKSLVNNSANAFEIDASQSIEILNKQILQILNDHFTS